MLEDGCGLKDPCEKEDVDVTANLTNQEKEDITRSAQVRNLAPRLFTSKFFIEKKSVWAQNSASF